MKADVCLGEVIWRKVYVPFHTCQLIEFTPEEQQQPPTTCSRDISRVLPNVTITDEVLRFSRAGGGECTGHMVWWLGGEGGSERSLQD